MQTTVKSTFRGDIQGLRAIAVGAVVFYHLWPEYLTGGFIGVDVFFVISGYLITSHLIRRPPENFRDVITFWLRRVKRLLPASFIVLATTFAGILLLAPITVWREWLSQVLAATFYVQNWKLAASSVDYLAEDNAASAVQHFWSLSVEEQFYFVWPVLIGLLVAWNRRSSIDSLKLVKSGVLFAFVLSLAFSVYLTAHDPGRAYFSTFTRAWELAAGGLIALCPTPMEAFRNSLKATAACWLGIAAILLSACLFNGTMPFPGIAALLPVSGTALVIWLCCTHRLSPYRLLSSAPARFTGDHSYALYLWHWPLIILLPYMFGGTLQWWSKVGLIALALLLSMATKTFIEDRFRVVLDTSRFVTAGRFLAIGSLSLGLLGLAGTFFVGQYEQEQTQDVAAQVENARDTVGDSCFGANSLENECAPSDGQILVPSPVAAKSDRADAYEDSCWAYDRDNYKRRPVCTYGDGQRKVALIGNSHAGQWLPALQEIAEDNDWTITTYLASRCAPMDGRQEFDAKAKSEGCYDYGQWIQQQTQAKDYDLIITSNRQSLAMSGHSYEESDDAAESGFRKYLETWVDQDIPVVVLRDTPFPGNSVDNIPDCVAENPSHLAACSGDEETWASMDEQYAAAQALPRDVVATVNMNDYLCRDGQCPAVIGSVIAYFDSSHISATYADSLVPMLAARLSQATSSFDEPVLD